MKDSPISSNGVNLGENGTTEKENMEISPKVNVFQFMMNNRHKSIGRNSPGREIDLNQSTDSVLSKKELKARKSKLENWAEQKGASKRKREYEEVGNTINHKLDIREKRLKKLLKFDGCQSDDEVITKRKKKMRKCAVIESDSDSGEEIKSQEKELKLTSSSVKSWKFKIRLSMADNKDLVENDIGNSAVENVVSQPENEVGKSEVENVVSQPENEIHNSKVENITQVENEIDISEVETIVTQLENETVENVTHPENETNLDDSVILITEEQEETVEGGRILRSRRSRPKNYEDYFISDEEETKNEKKKLKVAPVFLKALPKPKIDPKVAEARRQFLLSGIPSSLRKEMERQQCIEEIDFDVFPTVSHVQQKSLDNPYWELPNANLTLLSTEDTNIEIKNFTKEFINLSTQQPSEEKLLPTKLQNCKKIIKLIKSQNPDYPVYKIYNSFCKKPVKVVETPKRRGRPRKNPEKITVLPTKPDDNVLHALWTEKYKPKSSTDIIGNHNAVKSLKHWLTNWLVTSKSRKKRNDSESDFDSDSCDSSKTNGNTVIIKGPTGSGKTAAVYAVCSDLGLSVIEVNASSKRTGKRLLQELQEATQSHQVRKKDALSSFVNVKEKVEKKMCVLLIEDVDVVFEQDEGFISALSQIIVTSKRPIILTMTDELCFAVSKIINYSEIINFSPLTSILTIWLQIVCLVEGYYVKSHSIEELLNYYKGDIRRTLLQLQMFVNSGGQPTKNEWGSNVDKVEFDNEIKIDDDNSNFSDDCGDVNVQIHDNCLQVSDVNDLGVIWWNLPTLLNLPNYANVRLDKSLKIETEKQIDKLKLRMLCDCYDNLAYADVFCGFNQYHESLERRWRPKLKDSLCLEENLSNYENNELGQTLITRTLNMYSNQSCSLKVAVPTAAERRWRSKQLSTDEKLQEVVVDVMNKKSLALDYMPYLRAIARGDCERAANNTKRGNRYNSYLKNLGVRCNEATLKIACDVFKIWD